MSRISECQYCGATTHPKRTFALTRKYQWVRLCRICSGTVASKDVIKRLREREFPGVTLDK